MNDDTTNDIPDDDAEGHKRRHKIEDADTALDDDAEGHRYVTPDERPSIGETPAAANTADAEDDDAEGHKRYRR